MARDPERIFQARRAALKYGLMDTGMDEATADRWCDAWEIEAAGRRLPRNSAYLAGRRGVDRGRAGGETTGLGATDGASRPHTKPSPRERVLTAFSLAFFRAFGPLIRRAIHRGMAGPNVLVTVRGRRSGRPRTTPVAMLELGDVRYLQASFGDTDWVRNLGASGEARLARGGWSETFTATELQPETAGLLMRTALAPYHQSRFVGAILGPTIRPPVAVLYRYRLRVDDTPEEYVAEARRHPLFELHSKSAAATSAS